LECRKYYASRKHSSNQIITGARNENVHPRENRRVRHNHKLNQWILQRRLIKALSNHSERVGPAGTRVARSAWIALQSPETIPKQPEEVASQPFVNPARIARQTDIKLARKRPRDHPIDLRLYYRAEKLVSKITDLTRERFAPGGIMRPVAAGIVAAELFSSIRIPVIPVAAVIAIFCVAGHIQL
jgi:hypothetical protein